MRNNPSQPNPLKVQYDPSPAGAANSRTSMGIRTAGPSTSPPFCLSANDPVQKLKSKLDMMPELRQHRIDALRRAIRHGAFQVSSARIAEAMLRDLPLFWAD